MIQAAKLAGLLLLAGVTGCAQLDLQQVGKGEAPVVVGPTVRQNYTPTDPALACLAEELRSSGKPRLAVAVGDVKDYTGKYSESQGNEITQGGALMVYSALGKLGDAVMLQERFDTRIAELELAYIDRRQLGDGGLHVVPNGGGGGMQVPWVPYYGGTILRSNYYIVGGITELNYNIASGGAEVGVNLIGGRARTFTLNVGIDLRIVDTSTLVVIRTVSLQKQITGFEVGFDIFRFFGNDLYDINIGNKSQEPLQLGVRTALEQGVVELISAVAGLDGQRCLARITGEIPKDPRLKGEPPAAAETPAEAAPVVVPADAGPTVGERPISALPENTMGAVSGGNYQVLYDFGSTSLSGQADAVVGRMADDIKAGQSVTIQIIARDTENWAPQRRDELTDARIAALAAGLRSRGVDPSRLRVTWRPGPTDTGITRDGPGYQIFATLAIGEAR